MFAQIPGPSSRWGGLPYASRMMHDLLGFAQELVCQHGDVVGFRVGPARMILLQHPEHIHDVLVRKVESFVREPLIQRYFRPWLGRGILLSDGERWRQQRVPIQTAWQQLNPAVSADAAVRHTRRLLLARTGSEFDFAMVCEQLAFSIVLETAVGPAPPEQIDALFDAATVLQDAGIHRLSTFRQIPYWMPTASNRQMHRALREIRGLISDHLERCRREGTGDFARLLLAAQDRGELSPESVRDGLANLIFGGKETAGGSLLWTLYLLAQHPKQQRQAQQEVDAVLAGQSATWQDQPRLLYLEQVYKEALRLYPAVPFLSRQACRKVEIDGYCIPKHSHVILAILCMQRDERWFDEPQQFLPERFEPEREHAIPPHAFLPFGAGVHACIGRKLAMLEASMVLATLLAEATVELPDDYQPPRLKADLRLHPEGPLPLRLVSRKSLAPPPMGLAALPDVARDELKFG